jgi:hypothetical protein
MENSIEVKVYGPGAIETGKAMDGEELEATVNQDVEQFQEWFCTNVDVEAVKLSGPEIAILKSYLWYKTHPGEVPSGEATSS